MNDRDLIEREKLPRERPPYIDMVVGPDRLKDNARFGKFLGELREHAGLSRIAAARLLGVSAEYLRLIEVGKRTPALAQMRTFLRTYQANGEVGGIQPGGDSPDLIVINPRNDEPVIIEFTSRIRESGRRAIGSRTPRHHDNIASLLGLDDQVETAHAAELGFVVFLLAQADTAALRKVRAMLQNEVSGAIGV